jgi:hypothetical protein
MVLWTWQYRWLWHSDFTPRSGNSESYFSSVFNFPSHFLHRCTDLHSHHLQTSNPFLKHPTQCVLFLSHNSHPNKCELISHCCFTFSALKISDVECFVICLLATFLKFYSHPFLNFNCVVFLIFSGLNYMCVLYINQIGVK